MLSSPSALPVDAIRIPAVGSIAELEAAISLFPEPSPRWRDRLGFWTFWDVFGQTPRLYRYADFREGAEPLSKPAADWVALAFRVAFRAYELDNYLKATSRFRLFVGYRAIGIVARPDARAAAGDPEWWFFRPDGAAPPLVELDAFFSNLRFGWALVRVGELGELLEKRPEDARRRALWEDAHGRVARALASFLPYPDGKGGAAGYSFSGLRSGAGELAPPEQAERRELSEDDLDAEIEERRR